MRSSLSLGLGTACAIVAGSSGCTSIQSSDLKTAGMTATMTVAADGTGSTKATVALNVDNNPTDFVSLSSGDSLTATAGGSASRSLSQDTVLGEIDYVASFSGEGGTGTPYLVAFNRSTETSAPVSECTLPEPFEIVQPAPGASFSRSASDLTIAYAPAGSADAMSYSVQGSCVSQVSGQTVAGDPGVIVIPKGTLVAASSGQGGAQSGACQVSITVVRQRQGTLDPHFAGGTIVGEQVRGVMVGSVP
jgi:hypothetical protein